MRRVVITGIGAVTPIGIGRGELWAGLHTQRSGICRVTRFDVSGLRCQVAGEVHGFEPENWIPRQSLRGMDRFARFSVAAARMAVEDAGLCLNRSDRSRIGCFLGSGLAGAGHYELEYRPYRQRGLQAVDPDLAFSIGGAAGYSHIARELDISGPMSGNADSCSAGPIAIGRAARAIHSGEADVALAGAVEASLAPLCFSAFDLIRAMASGFNDCPEKACRPFDSARDGFVMGEGAAILTLESEDHARSRGATCLAEVSGYALTNDGYHMTAPRPDAREAARAISLSLERAGRQPEEIDVISAHGSSTPLNDVIETQAIKMALGEHAYRVPIVATKSRHAHALGATGAIEAAILALGLHHQWLPGALNLENPSPECDLDYARDGPVTGPFHSALSNSFGFGGINACLVLRAMDIA